MLRMLAKVAVAAAALAAVCAASSHWLLADWQTQAFLTKAAALLGTVIVGAAVFAGLRRRAAYRGTQGAAGRHPAPPAPCGLMSTRSLRYPALFGESSPRITAGRAMKACRARA